jgi:hypothetical protein
MLYMKTSLLIIREIKGFFGGVLKVSWAFANTSIRPNDSVSYKRPCVSCWVQLAQVTMWSPSPALWSRESRLCVIKRSLYC